ncbi:MAG: 3-deoxy-7-phosphoheptulonate synthase [Ruminococcaceae bacterium]|nr:3-deoxy-7-phosphoheptulonate synthase [Oscillospiraceae bacterium]
MIIVLKGGATQEQVSGLEQELQQHQLTVNKIEGAETTVLGLVGDSSRVDVDWLRTNEAVDRIIKVQEPFKLANRKFHPNNSVIKAGNVEIGGEKIVVMAGPCSVESEDQILTAAKEVCACGASILRGGAFKPRTSPYAFQGLRGEGLLLLKQARELTGMPVISEITNPFYLEMFVEFVDIIQVGARNMQNFELLKELGHIKKPILLKRGFSNTIEELLMSAEYIMSSGNPNVILCERGIRTFETYTRNTLDISAIPALKRESHLPVVIDPSHASGLPWMVEPLSLAAIAAGADGLIIEVHPSPKNARCDGAQSLTPNLLGQIMDKSRAVANAIGRTL